MRRVAFFALLVAVFVAAAQVAAAAPDADAPPVVTEAQVRKMKVKELRKFLTDRGQQCADCEEKSDFVKLALKHRETPLTVRAAKVPKGTLWGNWAKIGKDMCDAAVEKKAVEGGDKVCSAVEMAAENMFMQYGKRTATKLKKKPEALLKTSFKEIYHQAGQKMMKKLVAHSLKDPKKFSSTSAVQAVMEKDNAVKGVKFPAYLTNVGIENTNPMYDTIKDKALHDEM